METQFDGVTVRLITAPDATHITSPTLPGLSCSTQDLRQIAELLKYNTSGTITLDSAAPLEVINTHNTVELRQDGRLLVRITQETKPGTTMNDLTGFYTTLRHITDEDDNGDEFELRPYYGYFLDLDPSNATFPTVSVLNRQLKHIGTMTQPDLPPLRRFVDQTTAAVFLSNLLVTRGNQTVILSPDNRPREVPAGHRQTINFEAPLELTPDAVRNLINTAEFLLEFESTPQTLD